MEEKKFYSFTNPQRSIFLTEEYYKNTNINNNGGTITINQTVDFDKLALAIKQCVKQNDGCRIMLSNKSKNVEQWISTYKDFPIEIIDVSSKKELNLLTNEIISRPFALYNSYLLKFTIFRFPDNSGGFIINMHHLISDSWTLGIVINEIIEIYSAYLNNEQYVSKDIDLYSYKNYIITEQEYKLSNKYKKDKTYWEEVFSTIPDNATIPSVTSSNNSNISTSALREQICIPSDLLNQIKEYCNTHKVSVFNFLIAIFSFYISRVSSLEDFCIGTPILNRSNFKEKNTTGMFINILPLRVNVNNSISFKDFLNSVMSNSMSLLRHQKYSYQNIIEDLRKKQSNLPTLYNIMISYQITKMNKEQDTIPHETVWYFNNTIADDIDIHIFDLNDTNELNIAYDYKTDKYTSDDMKNIHKRILYIVSQILNNDNINLSDIEIVTNEEKNTLINEFNNNKTDYPRDKTIIELFEEQVKLTPDNVALVFEGRSLTYKELNEKANKLAYILSQRGIQCGDIISLFMEKSIETIIGILSILKVGGAFSPLDVDYPKERINYILENSNSRLILTTKSYFDKIKTNIDILDISLDENSIYGEDILCLDKSIISSPLDLAYIMYTSGSTGTPKGVMVCQRNIVRLVKNTNYIKFEENEHILQTGSIVFDACTFEIWGALLNGHTLYLISKEKLLDISYLENYLKENKITILWLTASLCNYISEQSPTIFGSVRALLTGGDVLSISHIQKIQNANPNLTIINGYGPTENTTFSACYTIPKNLDRPNIPIGYPISNSTCYIVSKSGKLQPIGTPGELWVGGDGVSLGYLNRDDLTKEKFISNPFTNGKIYKTGDLVCLLPDGRIEFIGRIDNQVKIRGFRVELSEIDSKILEYKGVSQVYTLVKKSNNQSIIYSYLTSKEKINIKDLKLFLKTSLPTYMVPTHIIVLDKFPLNINGKIDKNALPEPSENDITQIVPARNDMDKIIINSLQELLHQNEISIEDSFFDLGGDSLSAISLCTILYHKLDIELTVKDILNYPIIMDLSDFIQNEWSKNTTSFVKPTEKREYYPASSAQKRIYYASQMDENSTLYNISGGILLEKEPNINRLESCLKQLIDRHSSLRTYFTIINDEIMQKITENYDFTLQVIQGIWKEKDKIISNFVKPFDLHKPLLFRAKLVVFENKKTLLLIDMHHSISDGTSLSIFLKELCTLYNGETLEEKQIEYKDFAIWESNYFKSKAYENDKKYWMEEFSSELPILDMPNTLQRPSKQSFEGDSYNFVLDDVLSKEVLNISKEQNITPYMLLMATYFILLYKYTGEQDIVVGTPIMNREDYNLENVFGMFVNNLALKVRIDSNENIGTFLQTVKNICLKGFSHQSYPFNDLIKDLNIKRDVSRNPIFDTMFIYQNNGYGTVNFKGIPSSLTIADLKVSKFDFSLEVIPTPNNFEMRFEYCTKLFTKDYIKQMAEHYKNILTYTIHNLSSSILKINMLSEEEQNKILYEFNNTYMPYNKEMSLVSLFEKQVENLPKETAIIFEDSYFTYSSLNKKANRLANCLIEKYHIQKNQVVGILLKRSVETIISMLAVLKAGATYLLIDESLPFDRILYMLENSQSPLLITDNNVKDIDFDNKLILSEFNYEQYSQNNLNINSSNEDGFCVIYTSGSTGTPKGVLLKRIGVINMLLNYEKVLKTNNCKNFLSISAISFDMFIVENFVSLLSGKTVILSNEEQQKIPLYAAELITKYKVDFILTTPTRMNLLLENIKDSDVLNNIKVIQLGGEVFTPELYEKLKNTTKANIYNGYGPSEATACSSSKLVTSKDITIGTPFYNTKIYICNKDLNLVPTGFIGEICISGDGVGIGYINNKELTEKSFIKNPFGEGVLYRTGDLAYYQENGEIQYIGRRDFQIKIRGLRVELSEIEKQLLKLPNITNVAVIYNTDPQYIAAFYTATSQIDITNIRNELSKLLPLYMVPKYFKQLEELPITQNGKINKKQLQNYNIHAQETTINYVAPQTENQKLFCDIWSKLLNHQIGIEDNIFECGADSLLAIKFKTELLSYKINIPYSHIFKYPTVKELADNCTQVVKQEKEFDYSIINQVLDKNSIQNISKSKIITNDNNNILLLGSNGFVGAHTLYSFIKKDKGIAYCIVRNKENENGYDRLINTLHFYFKEELDPYINTRIIILTGNVLEENLGLSDKDFNLVINDISTIINTAAIVKHYGDEKKFEEINVELTKKVAEVCEKYNKRFLHISTTSVHGDSKLETGFSERNLYIGQKLDNIYIRTKFDAEKIILEKISNGLNAQILRIGNITNRFSDGVFQINAETNAFINRLKTFIKLKVIPQSLMKMPIEFTPVDLCADAIISILENYVPNISVLHLYNDQLINMEKLVNVLTLNGFDLKPVSDKQFEEIIQNTLKSKNKDLLSGIVVDMNNNTTIEFANYTTLNSEFSKFYLYLIGFNWSIIDDMYLTKYLKYLKEIKFI